jgi:hypothetical protein
MDEATQAQRAAAVCALLGVIGTSMGVVGFWSFSGPTLRLVQAVGILINGAGLLVLRAYRRPPPPLVSKAIFLLVLVPTTAMVWLADVGRAEHSARWVPYEPHKLSALTLAIIAPPGWTTGIAAISMFIGSALVHHVLLPDSLRARMAAGEPFGVIAYGTFALVLLAFKQRSRALVVELEHARADRVAMERVARLAMSLRDLANTSVQTLELVRVSLLGAVPRVAVQAERMRRALDRLRRLNGILLSYQNAVTWADVAGTLEGEVDPALLAKDAAGSEGAAPTSPPPPAPRPPA